VLHGVKWSQGDGGSEKRDRLKVTPPILRKIKSVWDGQTGNHNAVMLWAACCLAFFFFFFFWAVELTVPNDSAYDPYVYLSLGDLEVDVPENPMVLNIQLKAFKTEPF